MKNTTEFEGKMIVSACLAGIPCNYKGEAKSDPQIVRLVSAGKAIPVCPECLGGLAIPRAAAERKGEKVVTKDGIDVTAEFVMGAGEVLKVAMGNGCKSAVLKARSPSCGKGVIYDGSFCGKLVKGNGVTADILIKNGIEVKSEEDI